MRTICDACERAPAILFCAADEAALCLPCDEKVHMCNKLASRHVRVQLAEPIAVPPCDICENSPAFFFCEIDGSSLCLQCDVIVHVGGKKTHKRYILLRQQVKFSGEKPSLFEDLVLHHTEHDDKREKDGLLHQGPLIDGTKDKMGSYKVPPVAISQLGINHNKNDPTMIDLNVKPHWMQGHVANSSQVSSLGLKLELGIDLICPHRIWAIHQRLVVLPIKGFIGSQFAMHRIHFGAYHNSKTESGLQLSRVTA